MIEHPELDADPPPALIRLARESLALPPPVGRRQARPATRKRARFILANPDPDQLTGYIVPLRQAVQRLSSQALLGDLPLKRKRPVGDIVCLAVDP